MPSDITLHPSNKFKNITANDPQTTRINRQVKEQLPINYQVVAKQESAKFTQSFTRK